MFLFSGTFFPIDAAARLRSSRRATSRRSGTAWSWPAASAWARGRRRALGHVATCSSRRTSSPWVARRRSSDGRAHRDPRRRPPGASAALRRRRSTLLIERNLLVYRHIWSVIVSGFFEPVFYLLSIGVGLGDARGRRRRAGRATDRLHDLRRAGAARVLRDERRRLRVDVNIFFKLQATARSTTRCSPPRSASATSRSARSLVALMRGAVYAVAFLVVMLGLGLVEIWWAVLAVPAAVLIGFAFAASGMAATTFMRSWPGLRPGPARHPAAVPLLGDLLPAVGPTRRRSRSSSSSRRCTTASTCCGRSRPGRRPRPARPRRLSRGDDRDRAFVATRRLDRRLRT